MLTLERRRLPMISQTRANLSLAILCSRSCVVLQKAKADIQMRASEGKSRV